MNHPAWLAEMPELLMGTDEQLSAVVGSIAVIPPSEVTAQEVVSLRASAYAPKKEQAAGNVQKVESTLKNQLHSVADKCREANSKNVLYRPCLTASLYTAYDSGWMAVEVDEVWDGRLGVAHSLVLRGLTLGLTNDHMRNRFHTSFRKINNAKNELHDMFDVPEKGLGMLMRRAYEAELFIPSLEPAPRLLEKPREPQYERVALPNSAFTLIHRKKR